MKNSTRYVRRSLANDQENNEVDSSDLDQSKEPSVELETELESPIRDRHYERRAPENLSSVAERLAASLFCALEESDS